MLPLFLLSPETATPPPPPAVLDPGPGAHYRLNLGLGACHHRPPSQALGYCRAAAVDLDSASLRACHRHRPLLYLPQSEPPSSTFTLPPSEFATTVVLDPDLPRYQALTCLWQFVWNLWLFVIVCANLNVNELSWKIFAPLCDCLCECEWNLNMFHRIFVKEIRICFIGLRKLVTKDNSFMFYRISVNFWNFSEICDCL
jgi:hypothetical protein